MADTAVASLTASSALAGTELFYADNGSADVKVTATQIKTWTSSSPTLVTPALGTPASGVATNLTGTAAGLTAGNVSGTGVASATSLALGGATIGSDALAVTGTGNVSGSLTCGQSVMGSAKIGSGTKLTCSNDNELTVCNTDISTSFTLTAPGTATFQFGSRDAASPTAQTVKFQSASTVNNAGVNATIIGSLSRGSGNSGDFIFQTGVKSGVSGTAATATTALTIKGETQAVNLAGALNVTGATTLSAALTYGGVALSNAVTGTGNMVLSASPTFSGTVGGTGVIPAAALASTAVTPASYTLASITVDQQGRITAASNGTAGALSSKVIAITRNLTTATGSVAYTGVGFVPTSLVISTCATSGSTAGGWSTSHVDSARGVSTSWTDLWNLGQVTSGAATTLFVSDGVATPASTCQTATVTSFDSDGFTLSWTKVGTPTDTSAKIAVIAYK